MIMFNLRIWQRALVISILMSYFCSRNTNTSRLSTLRFLLKLYQRLLLDPVVHSYTSRIWLSLLIGFCTFRLMNLGLLGLHLFNYRQLFCHHRQGQLWLHILWYTESDCRWIYSVCSVCCWHRMFHWHLTCSMWIQFWILRRRLIDRLLGCSLCRWFQRCRLYWRWYLARVWMIFWVDA